MTIPSIFIVSRKIPFHSSTILPATLRGVLGQIISITMGWSMSNSNLKWLFNIHIAALGIALILQHFYGIKRIHIINIKTARPLLFCTGIIGGFLTINIGSGAGMVAFIILTLVLGSTEKKVTPTTVIIMALNSIIGVILTSFTQD